MYRIELENAWNLLIKWNDELPIDQRLKTGILPWAHRIDAFPEDRGTPDEWDMYQWNGYEREIPKNGKAVYIANKKGYCLFLPEKVDELMDGFIFTHYGKNYSGEFIAHEAVGAITFSFNEKKNYFSTISYDHESGEFKTYKLSPKNLMQLFSNLHYNRGLYTNLSRTYELGSYCFIATAVYGSPYAKEVIALKEFRDNFLLKKSLGRAFVNFYYIVSPPIAKQIAKRIYLREITKSILIIPVLKLANYLKRKDS
ncbi:MAG TPA: CFI-box-CTERM domain-containing protein [Paludibacter sp.]